MSKFVVSVSGGLASFEALRRTIEKHGKENTIGVFADVGTVVRNGKVVCGEDEDLFRFLDDTERLLGFRITRIQHPEYRSIWDVFFKRRFLGNPLSDICSSELKRKTLRKWIKVNAPGATQVLGYSWLEQSRATKFRAIIPNSYFPNCERPYIVNEDIINWLEDRGVKAPRLYYEGAQHNNCGLFCVKGGLGQLRMLWLLRPHRYAYAEAMELRFRDEIDPWATIFKKGDTPISLMELRWDFEKGYIPKGKEQGCGGRCMIPEEGEELE